MITRSHLLALVIGLLLLIVVGCITVPRQESPPEPPPVVPVLPPAPTPVEAPAPGSPEAERDRLRAALAAAESNVATKEAEAKKTAQAKAEAPLRSLLVWSIWAGGALAIAATVALGITFTPWGSWIPGGRATCGVAIATGAAVIFTSKALWSALSLAWLPWVVLAVGGGSAVLWVVYLMIKHTASHADRMEAAMTEAAIASGKLVSIADQSKAGVRGLITLARKVL